MKNQEHGMAFTIVEDGETIASNEKDESLQREIAQIYGEDVIQTIYNIATYVHNNTTLKSGIVDGIWDNENVGQVSCSYNEEGLVSTYIKSQCVINPTSDAAYAMSDFYLNLGKTLEIAETAAGIPNGNYKPQGIIIDEEQVSKNIIKFFDKTK